MTKRRSPEERIEQLEWALQRISDVCCYQTHQNPTDDLAVINNLVGMVRPAKENVGGSGKFFARLLCRRGASPRSCSRPRTFTPRTSWPGCY